MCPPKSVASLENNLTEAETMCPGNLEEKHPEIAGDVTDCLSGDVNKDFTKLFRCVEDFCPVPEALDLGAPLESKSEALLT